MKNVLLTAILLSVFFISCDKNNSNNTNSTSKGVEVLPWEFDLTINGTRHHWKSTNDISNASVHYCQFLPQSPYLGFGFRGLNKLSPDYISGDVIMGFVGGMDLTKLGEQNAYFKFIFSNDIYDGDSIKVKVSDYGIPFKQEIVNGKVLYINGRSGEAEIPNQTIKLEDSLVDSISIFGTFKFWRYW